MRAHGSICIQEGEPLCVSGADLGGTFHACRFRTPRSDPGSFREPGLDRAATGQARVFLRRPLGGTGKVPNRVCDFSAPFQRKISHLLAILRA